MKSRMTKIAAVALAATMCVPAPVLASGTTATRGSEAKGSFQTSFDLYSPKLNVSVPLKADIKVNPMAENTKTGVDKFTVASNSLDIYNASTDIEADVAIPVNVAVKATITSSAEDVVTEYNTFTADATSAKKRINLMLSQAQTAAVIGVKSGSTAGWVAADDKHLKLDDFEVTTKAVYTSPVKSTPVTLYGSQLSVDIAGPSTSDSTAGKTFSSDPTKITPTVGSFAITGVANTAADWKASDVAVEITYNVRASKPLSITTPAITTAPTFNSASPADLSITVPNVGEAKVVAMALHNKTEKDLYGDFMWPEDEYTVTYAPNATTTTQTDATIKLPKDNATFTFLTDEKYKTKAQDLIIGLSDGRMIVTTLTVN